MLETVNEAMLVFPAEHHQSLFQTPLVLQIYSDIFLLQLPSFPSVSSPFTAKVGYILLHAPEIFKW